MKKKREGEKEEREEDHLRRLTEMIAITPDRFMNPYHSRTTVL